METNDGMESQSELSTAAATLVQEVALALDRLLNQGEGTVIDVRTLPLVTEADRDELHALLGEGEVSAAVEAAGPTEVVETAYPGVWWVTYWSQAGEVVAERIEVAHIPAILAAQEADIRDGLTRLAEHLPAPSGDDTPGQGPAIRWQDD